MFLDFFIKPNFISFYKEGEKYLLLNKQYKKNRVIFSETKEFDNTKDLVNYINEIKEDNPQTYISTFLTTPNQGAVPSCDKSYYKNLGIETQNIKINCINNQYSFYTTLYELMQIKKEYSFIDLIYSAFSLIDFKSTVRKNVIYILSTKENIYILIYNNKPFFSDIYTIVEDDENSEEEVEDISDIDLIDDFDESLDEDIDNIEEIEEEKEYVNIENLNIEYKIVNFIKSSLKEYYKSETNFIEKIIIFDSVGLDKNITNIIFDELFIEANLIKFDILKTLNELSRKDV